MSRVTANFRQYLVGWGQADRSTGDLEYYRGGLAQPQFNGVVRVRSLDLIDQAVATARVRLADVPWWWWVGPDSPAGTSAALVARGAVRFGVLPLMTRPLEHVADLEGPSPGLSIEAAEAGGRLAELVVVYSTSMGVTPGVEPGIVRIEAQHPDNADIVRLAAIVEGRVVGMTVVVMAHGVAGIFLVHVAEQHRRRGIGAALTAAALRTGQERGMGLAALLASPAGEPL